MAVFIGGIGSATKNYQGMSKSDGQISVFYSKQFKKWQVSYYDKFGDEIIDYFDSKPQIEKWFGVKLKSI